MLYLQWPFQEPKLEVPTIYKAYVILSKIWPNIWYSSSILGSWNSHWYPNDIPSMTRLCHRSRPWVTPWIWGWRPRSPKRRCGSRCGFGTGVPWLHGTPRVVCLSWLDHGWIMVWSCHGFIMVCMKCVFSMFYQQNITKLTLWAISHRKYRVSKLKRLVKGSVGNVSGSVASWGKHESYLRHWCLEGQRWSPSDQEAHFFWAAETVMERWCIYCV